MNYPLKLIFFLILCSATQLFAELRSFECLGGGGISSTEGKKLIEKVQTRYGDVSGLSANFHQESYLGAMEVSEMSEGRVNFVKPGKMRWLYTKPEEQTFLVRDETLWLYQKDDNQVVIDDFKSVLISDLPVSFLMGLGDLAKDFVFRSGCKNPEGIVLNLAPNKGDSEKAEEGVQEFSLLVRESSSFPIGARVTDVGGNVTSILLTEVQFNPPFDEKLFAADFPKGVDINDRRGRG